MNTLFIWSQELWKTGGWLPTGMLINEHTELAQAFDVLQKSWNIPFLCVSSAFSKTRLLSELRRVLSCELPAVFLHFPLEEQVPWGPFYQLRRVLAKGRHLLQILLKALIV